jgi:hypothetical protein
MLFGHATELPRRIEAVYRFELHEYRSTQSLQLTLQHWRPV